jgi:hypothetical protein
MLKDPAAREEQDHRIVAQAPGRNGLVDNGRALKPGTAARATTVFGCYANPAAHQTRGIGENRGTYHEARARPDLREARAGNGAPTQALFPVCL